MDLFVCFNCNTVVDADKCREDYMSVCPMDTADAGYEIGYHCSNCGCFIARCYKDISWRVTNADDAPDGAKEGDKICHKNLKKSGN